MLACILQGKIQTVKFLSNTFHYDTVLKTTQVEDRSQNTEIIEKDDCKMVIFLNISTILFGYNTSVYLIQILLRITETVIERSLWLENPGTGVHVTGITCASETQSTATNDLFPSACP